MVIPQPDRLLCAFKQGDSAESAEEFAQRAWLRFARAAQRAGIPAQDCEDVAQEALLAALSQWQRGLFRGDSSVDTWLARIVQGKIADYWRARGKGGVSFTSIDEEENSDVLALSLIADCDYSLVVGVREVLRELPKQHRVILVLNRTAGYTIEEISRIFGLTVGQVSARLYAAEDMFIRALNGEPIAATRGQRQLIERESPLAGEASLV
jgi:RNA polymerase sigma factor (sigma-70 family)